MVRPHRTALNGMRVWGGNEWVVIIRSKEKVDKNQPLFLAPKSLIAINVRPHKAEAAEEAMNEWIMVTLGASLCC